MKNVLITGAGSYLGMHIAAELEPAGMRVNTLDMHEPLPEAAFVGWDTVIHVAGIVHRQETESNMRLYDQVNRELAVQTAMQAKAQGVRQFIFFSSMSVYGMTVGHITAQTAPAPNTAYGLSKWAAEQALAALNDDGFQVAVLRPPMIYGKGCRGNYPRLRALALRTPVFPKAGNARSMLYIGHLCAFVRGLVQSGEGGLFFPQNREYVSTDALVMEIAKANHHRLWQPRGLGGLLRLLSGKISLFGKVFGSLTYDHSMSESIPGELDFARTIAMTEERE